MAAIQIEIPGSKDPQSDRELAKQLSTALLCVLSEERAPFLRNV